MAKQDDDSYFQSLSQPSAKSSNQDDDSYFQSLSKPVAAKQADKSFLSNALDFTENAAAAAGNTALTGAEDVGIGALTGAGHLSNLVNRGMQYVPGLRQVSNFLMPKDMQISDEDIDLWKDTHGGTGTLDKIAKGVGDFLPTIAVGGPVGEGVGLAAKGISKLPLAQKLFSAAPELADSSELVSRAKDPGFLKKALTSNAVMSQLPLGAVNYASSYGYNDPNVLRNSSIAGLTNSLLAGATAAGLHGFNAMRPSNLLASNLSDAELQRNLAVSAGTKTPLGSVLDNPNLTKFGEDTLQALPLTGMSDILNQNKHIIINKAQELGDNLGIAQNVPSTQELRQTLIDAKKDITATKNANYDAENKLADSLNVKVNRDNFSQTAKDELSKLQESPELMREASPKLKSDLKYYASSLNDKNAGIAHDFSNHLDDIQLDKDLAEAPELKKTDLLLSGMKDTFDNLRSKVDNKNIDNTDVINKMDQHLSALQDQYSNDLVHAQIISNVQDKLRDIKDAAPAALGNNLKYSNIFKGTIGDKAQKSFENQDNFDGEIYKRLHKSLEDDVNKAIENSGSQQLKDLHNSNQDYYKNTYKPMQHADIHKFTQYGNDSDLILNHFIKSGNNDRDELLGRLVNALPDDKKDLPMKMYYAKAKDEFGNIDPKALVKLHGNLGPDQKAALIRDPELRNQLDSFSQLMQMNPASMNDAVRASTGQRLLKTLGAIGAGGLAIHTGNVPGAIGSLVGLSGASRLGTRYLTNEDFRNKLVQQMIANRAKGAYAVNPNTYNSVSTLAHGLANINHQDQQ